MGSQAQRLFTVYLGMVFAVVVGGASCPSTPPPTPPPGTTGYLYVQLSGTLGIAGYTFNSTTGKLTPLTSSPFFAGTTTADMAWDQGTKRLFAADRDAKVVRVHRQFFAGQLGAGIPSGVAALGSLPHRIAQLGGFVYVSDDSSPATGFIAQLKVNANDSLSPLPNPLSNIAGLDPAEINFLASAGGRLACFGISTPTRCQIRVPDAGGDLLTGHELNTANPMDSGCPSANGLLGFIAHHNTLTSVSLSNPISIVDTVSTSMTVNDFVTIAADPLGRAVYIGGDGTDTIASVPTSPTGMFGASSAALPIGGNPEWMVTDDQGDWLFVSSIFGQFVKVFRINADGTVGIETDSVTLNGARKIIYTPF